MSDKQPKQGEVCWSELMTTDPQKAKAFYGELLGWEFNDMDMGEMTYTMVRNGDKEIAGIMETPQIQGETVPPHWMSYIYVDDLDAKAKQIETLGGKVMVPVTPIPGFGRFCVFEDPTGAHLALWQSDK